jgi:hypothetical protein
MSVDERRQDGASASAPDDVSPLLGSWRKVYAVVLLELAVTVGLLYALTRWAS